MAAPSDLPSRLLLAAARSYLAAHGLDRADPPADPERYARWLGETRHTPEDPAIDSVIVEVPLGDLLAAVKTIRRLEADARHHATEAGTFDRWLSVLRQAGARMRDTSIRDIKARAKVAVGILGLTGKVTDPDEPARLALRWWELTESPDGPHLSPDDALVAMARERYPNTRDPEIKVAAIRSRLYRARKALSRDDIRRLP